MVPALSLVIPANDEQHRLERTLPVAKAWLEAEAPSHEIIVVDDGSTDQTALVAARFGRVHVLPRNRGKGAALAAGVRLSSGARVLLSDADFSTPITDLPLLSARLDQGVTVAIASRAHPAARLEQRQAAWRENVGRVFNFAVQQLVLPGFADTQCGFKLYEGTLARQVAALAQVEGFACDVEWLVLALKAGARVEEVPVSWRNDPDTRVRVGKHAPRMLWDIAGVRRRLGRVPRR